MDKLNMQTANIADDNFKKLAELFPNAVTETINENGEIVRAIDKDVLMQEINTSVVEGREERYQFTWPDKRAASRLANTPSNMTLRPCVEDSVGKDGTPGGFDSENLYIEGDNLEVLKLLREDYLGKVKMIYIDPPYNTGKDFVYNDDFAISNGEFEERGAIRDENGNLVVDPMQRNTESNGRFHTDWLNMIYPRLKVARDLLADDGVIFISIDDNEVENLRKVCDEIFGSNNFIADFVWEKRLNRENRKAISVRHDYILSYCKNIESCIISQLPMDEKALANYSNPDNDPRGLWKSDPAHTQGGHGTKSQFYTLIAPNGKKHELPSGRCWVYTESVMQKAIADNRIWFGKDGNGVPRIKTYLNAKERGLTPETILFAKDVSTNEGAKNKLKDLFDGIAVFETPKPEELLKLICKIASSNECIVLDFFSGAATTAHAVMQLNAEDGGKRRFIMVQLPELTEESSEAYKAGYANICEIGKERIRRAGRKVKEEEGLQGQDLDIGFRVLKLDTSNMEDVFYTPEDFNANNLFTMVDNVKEGRTAEDLLFQIMPELNIPLSAKIEECEINGKKVFVVDDGYLIATFDKDVNTDIVKVLAQMKPQYFVMRDASAESDNVLDDFEQIFRHYSPDTIRKIL